MRSVLLLPLALALAACGDHGAAPVRDEKPAPPAWAPPPVVSNGPVSAQVLWVERDRDHVAARLRLENTSPTPVQLRNLGDTLTGFRCAVEGRSYSAERQHRDQAMAAASLTELPGQTPVELDLRWRINPLRTSMYDCTIVVGNLFQDGHKLDDLSIAVPSPMHEEARKAEAPAQPKPEQPKSKDVSL
jgi:hypothetical protein